MDKLNAMFDVIKNSTDEDPRLSEDFLEYINGRDTNFGRGMNMQRNFIDNKFEPDPERPEAGHWKVGTSEFLCDGEPVTETDLGNGNTFPVWKESVTWRYRIPNI